MEWMILPFKRYAEFKGRSRRMEFWMFGLLQLIVYGVLFGVAMAMGFSLDAAGADAANPMAMYGAFFSGAGLLLVLWWLVTLVPSLAVSIRRLHDRDMSGWWYLGFIVGSMIPFIGVLVSLAMLVIFALPGTPGPNRFGEDPKNPTSAEVFA